MNKDHTMKAAAVLAWLLFIFACLLACAGCGTVAGIGSDLQRAAAWTQYRIDNGFDNERSE